MKTWYCFSGRCCVLVTAVVASACGSETLPPDAAPLAALADGVSPAESLAIAATLGASMADMVSASAETCVLTWSAPGVVNGCSAPVPSVFPISPWLQHSGGRYEPEQREPIDITFSGAVRGLTLESTGALKCTGTHGRMVGFRAGAEVARADNVLIDPADCGDDDVTYGVRGTLPPDIDVDRLVIEGVEPWQFEVLGQCCGRALLQYTLQFQPASLVCDIVVRGQVTTCQVLRSVDAVSGWRFAGKLDLGPAGQNDSLYVNGSSTDLTWSGAVALPGTVFAFVSTNGVPDTLSGALVLTPRDWTGKAVQGSHGIGQGDLPVRPTTDSFFGRADYEFTRREDIVNYYEVVEDGGPNDGLGYFTDVPFRTETFANVNYAALQVGSDFYLIQEERDRRIRGVSYCGRDRVPALVPDVEAHEGTDPDAQPNSHVGIYLRHVESVTGPRVEPLVALGFSLDLNPIQLAIHDEASADSEAMDDDERNALILPCVFRYDYSGLP